MVGAADGLVPALDPLGPLLGGDLRQEGAIHRPILHDLVRGAPIAHGKARKVGRAKSRGLHAAGTLNGQVTDVGHGLHQVVVGARAAVHFESLHGDAGVGLHGVQDIVDLIAQAVQRGADDVVFVAATGQAHDGAAGVLIPVGRAEAGESGHDVAAVGVLDLLGHVLGVTGVFQQPQLVPQPLDRGTGHEDRTFQRIIHAVVAAARDGGDEAVLRDNRRFAGVHQKKAAGAEGVLRFARRKAGLAEEGGLLVARRACNFDARAEVHRVGLGVETTGGHGRGQHLARDVQLPQDLLIPLQRVNVEEHGAAGVGDDLMMLALDAGAEDFSDADDSFEITTAPEDFDAVHKALEEQNIPMASAEVTMIPQTYVTLTDEADITNIGRILDFLDDDDDVQEVYHNWEE